MGAIGGLLGTAGGTGGTGFNAQDSGVNQGQLQNAYAGSQNSMQAQQNLLSALQAQNGLGNQSQVYNQYQNIASGNGPNPAQAMLNQATGANVANQAALMAGQRGAGANVGLMARQAAQQGANLQQQAAGQGASMQAQQALGALGQAGGMANTMAGNQIGQTNANTQAAQNEQNMLLNAQSAHNNVMGSLANTTMQGQQALIGGAMNAAGAGAGMKKAFGGPIGNYDEGGAVGGSAFGPQSMFGQFVNSGPSSSMQTGPNAGAEALQKGMSGLGSKKSTNPMAGASNPISDAGVSGGAADAGIGTGDLTRLGASRGGKVPAMVSPGERFLKPGEAKAVAKGQADPMQVGQQVPGKAKVKGDSYKNDIVPAKLDVGGVVIPKSIMESKNPAKGAADFVRSVMAKKGRKS